MDFDSYESITPVEEPKRRRRPWWRWNLITLAVALFVLMWVREISGAPPSLAWMGVITVFFLWGLGPAPFADWKFLTMQPAPPVRRRPQQDQSGYGFALIWCRFLALVLLLVAVCTIFSQLYFVVGQQWRGFSRQPFALFWQLVTTFGQSLVQIAIATLLWLVPDILQRLSSLAKSEPESLEPPTLIPDETLRLDAD